MRKDGLCGSYFLDSTHAGGMCSGSWVCYAYFYVTFNFCLGVGIALMSDPIFCPITELKFSNFFQTYLLKLTETALNYLNQMSRHMTKPTK